MDKAEQVAKAEMVPHAVALAQVPVAVAAVEEVVTEVSADKAVALLMLPVTSRYLFRRRWWLR